MGSTMAPLSTQDVAAQAFAKMMLCSERYRGEAQANWTPGVNGSLLIAPNPDGEPFVGAITDFFSGGGGARTFTDGIDSGGIFHSMASRMANAETVESRVPVLQVYRRELEDAGGPGRFRGGVAVEFATVPHKLPIRPAGLNNVGSGISVPAGRGLSGRLPGAASRNVDPARLEPRRRCSRPGAIPLAAEEVGSRAIDVLAAKSFTMIDEGDVLIGVARRAAPASAIRCAATRAGRRARRRARASCRRGARASVYGVVLADGALDEAADRSAARERDPRRARLEQGRAARRRRRRRARSRAGVVLHPVSDSVEAVERDGERSLRCSVCHYRYGPYEHDHKRSARDARAAADRRSARTTGSASRSSSLREFYCPGCATALAADVQRRDEPILDETKLSHPRA